jgi:hypothetical protein
MHVADEGRAAHPRSAGVKVERPEGGVPPQSRGRDLDAEHRRVKWEVSSEMEDGERAGTREP